MILLYEKYLKKINIKNNVLGKNNLFDHKPAPSG